MHLLPGGYNFIHVVFWTVMALVSVGTMTVATILAVGLGLLLVEQVGKA